MIGELRKGWEWLEIPRMCFDRPGIRRNKAKRTGFVKCPPKVRRIFLTQIVQAAKRACQLYVTDGKPFLHDAVVLFLIDQPIDQVEGLDPIVGCVHARIQGEDDLLVIVLNLLQGSQFPSSGVLVGHGLGDLNIELVVGSGGDEVHLSLIHLADGHIVATAEQFKIDYILIYR